jgi:hypothetical protein
MGDTTVESAYDATTFPDTTDSTAINGTTFEDSSWNSAARDLDNSGDTPDIAPRNTSTHSPSADESSGSSTRTSSHTAMIWVALSVLLAGLTALTVYNFYFYTPVIAGVRSMPNGGLGLTGRTIVHTGTDPSWYNDYRLTVVTTEADPARHRCLKLLNSAPPTISPTGVIGATGAAMLLQYDPGSAIQANYRVGSIKWNGRREATAEEIRDVLGPAANDAGAIEVHATQNWTSTTCGSKMTFSTTLAGSTQLTERMILNENGQLVLLQTTTGDSQGLFIRYTGTSGMSLFCQSNYKASVIRDHGGFGIEFSRKNSTGPDSWLGRFENSGRFSVNNDTINIASSKTPDSATADGTKGDICYGTDFIYVCIGSRQWKRASLNTW